MVGSQATLIQVHSFSSDQNLTVKLAKTLFGVRSGAYYLKMEFTVLKSTINKKQNNNNFFLEDTFSTPKRLENIEELLVRFKNRAIRLVHAKEKVKNILG